MTDVSVPEDLSLELVVARVADEFLDRQKQGERPDVEAYAARYPQAAPVLRKVLASLQLLALSATAGVAEVGTASGEPATGTLGDFRILREVGRGGMGVVYEAEQISLGRRVALKVLPFASALDARQLQRFRNEAHAAAQLHHTNIVPVYYVGCERGVHFYAMQFIEGRSLAALVRELRRCTDSEGTTSRLEPLPKAVIGEDDTAAPHVPAPPPGAPTIEPTTQAAAHSTEPASRNPLHCRAVANLGLQAAEALEHAHQQGVVHRDVKPANLLLDGRGNLWVTDFGLARVQGDPNLTCTGDVLGTLRYSSPEQTRAGPALVDQRTDVYSLGVTLYELLTLRPAFTGRDRQELLRQIACEEPSLPRRLNPAVPVELETIVLKAMAKLPEERYATAQEFGDDLRRYLEDRPIQARRPTLTQRLRKLAKRHRPLVWSLAVSGALLLILAVLGLTLSNVYVAREKKEKDAALAKARQNAEDAEANLLLARQAVDEMYTKVAKDLASQLYLLPFERDVLEKALGFYQEFARRKSGDPAARRETASAWLRVGNIHWTLAHYRQAKQACDKAIALLEELAAEFPADPERRAWLASAFHLRGALLSSAGQRQQAEKCFRQVLAIYGELAAEDPNNAEHRAGLAGAYLALGSLLSDRPPEAEKALRRAVTLYEELVAGRRDPARYRTQLGSSYTQLGNFLADLSRFPEAERVLRQAMDLCDQAVGSSDQLHARLLRSGAEFHLGRVLAGSRRREEAERAYRHSIAELETVVAVIPHVPGYQQELAVRSAKLAAFLARAGKKDEAATFRRRARELFDKLEIELLHDNDVLNRLLSAVSCLRDAGDPEGAERFCRKALSLARKLAEEGHDEPASRERVAAIHAGLGTVLQRRGRGREAADQFRQALTIHEQLAGEFPDEPSYRYFQVNLLNFLGIALRDLPGEAATALPCHQQALGLCEALVAGFPDRPLYRRERVRCYFSLGIVLRLTGRPAEAVQAFERAVEAYRPYGDTFDDPENRKQSASVHNDLAWLLATRADVKLRDPGRAVVLAQKAVELAAHRGESHNTLGVAFYRAGDYKAAIEALEKSEELARGEYLAWNAFFLAMAHWKLGEKEQARKEYEQAVQWMEKNRPRDEELRRFRAEAEELLTAKEKN
jgi:serine/threonine protein kinase/Flp pilus assembly protein TadD